MRRNLSLTVALLLLCGGGAWAADCPAGTATLMGTYLHTFEGNGYLSGPQVPLPSGASASFVAAGQTTFDGVGEVIWRDSSSLGGLSIRNRVFTGRYEIDPDSCTGIISFPTFGEVARIVASPDGQEAFFLNSFPGVTITGLFRLVPSGSCSEASFTGTYRSLLSGAVYKAGAPVNGDGPSLRFAGVGRLALATDTAGSGTFEWTSTDSTAGRIVQRILRGTHSLDFATCRALSEVSEECVDGSCKNVQAGTSTGQFTASPAGDQLVYLSTTTNVTVAGRLARQ